MGFNWLQHTFLLQLTLLFYVISVRLKRFRHANECCDGERILSLQKCINRNGTQQT